jgi:tripartite-type tricarboxylate transporter receptor subunit TctC
MRPDLGSIAMLAHTSRSTVLALFFGLAALAPAVAQTYPSRPVTLVVPFGAGGPVDTLARILAERMKEPLGQNVLVETVTGASGSLGVGRVVRAPPDGYTVSIGNWPTHVVNGAIMTLPYDLLKDLEPVTLLAANPYVVVARKDLPAATLPELIAWLKANPEKGTEGTGGPGSGQHVSGAYFQKVTGTSFRFVPYRAGSVDVIRDMAGGHIDITFDQAITALGHVRAGTVKALAVTQKGRLAAAPDIPSVDEAGAPGVYITTWTGLWLPAGTPKDIVAKLAAAARFALADPAVARRLAELGQEIFPVDQQTPAGLAAFHKAEIEKWWPLIKAAGIRAEEAR